MVNCPGAPTTLNFRFSSVPDPERAVALKAEIIRCPELPIFDETDIPLLNVPVVSNGIEAGCMIAGSNVICKSYKCAPRPVRSPIMIGIVIGPELDRLRIRATSPFTPPMLADHIP